MTYWLISTNAPWDGVANLAVTSDIRPMAQAGGYKRIDSASTISVYRRFATSASSGNRSPST